MAGIARPFIPWIGSKEKLIPYIWQVFPSNPKLYLEPFGGGGALLLGIQPKISRMDIYNDFNCDLVNLFLCARECTIQLVQELKFLPLHSRAEFDLLKEFMKHKELLQQRIADERNAVMECFSGEEREELLQILRERSRLFDVQRAAAYYKVCRGSFSGTTTSFGVKPNNLTNFLYLFDDASKRLQDVIIENKDCLDIIRERDGPDSLIYCDPPYFDAESLYAVDFPKEKHEELHHILRNVRDTSSCRTMTARSSAVCTAIFIFSHFAETIPSRRSPARPTANSLSRTMTRARTSSRSSVCSLPRSKTATSYWCMNLPAARCGRSIPEEGGGNMDDHNEMYEIGLTAPMEMAEEYRLDEMLPMMGLKIGKRCIILISNSVNAEEVLDALETLRCAEEKLMVVLEDACGRCDSVCEAQAFPTDSAEKEVLQKIPDVLMFGLRGRGLCLRQLARHLVKGDTIYEK